MIERTEKRKKPLAATESPLHTITVGAVAADIWRRMSPAGYEYLDFSLCRSWKILSSGGTGNSRNFFSRNEAELMKVVEEACRWIADHERVRKPISDDRNAS